MSTKYLDKVGLSYFWTKIKAYVASLLGTKADDADVVHRDGDEFISGMKEFGNSYYDSTRPSEANWESSSLIIRFQNYVKGSGAPAANKYANLIFLDKEGDNVNWGGRLGSVETDVLANGQNRTKLVAYKNEIAGGVDVRDYVVMSVGYDADGNKFAAAPSTSSDRTAGNDIVTRDWIPLDDRIVHTTGNEVISGTKTFSSTIDGSINGNAATVTGTAGTSILAWNSEVTLYTVGGNAIKAKLPANPNTDVKVKQYVDTTNIERPILSRYNATEATQTANYVVYDTGVTNNPNTHTLTASGGFIGNLTGNVTGNCSGSSGSCTGNAATATKLATARSINGTSFDGSANITTANWGTARNISISDSDGTNTGTAVSVNGSGNATLKLPATIKASVTGNVSGSSGSCTGNAVTATKLATARNINGVSFDGSADITVADSTKLPLAGGTVTGNITMFASKSIIFDLSATAPTANTPRNIPIQFKSKSVAGDLVFTNYPFFEIPSTQDANYGMGVGFGAGGLTIVGAGEAGKNIVPAESLDGYAEKLVLASDDVVEIYTNCQRIENRVKTTIDNAGNFSGKASNVTGTVAIANGGTGATTRLNAVKALTNENVGTDATFFLTITGGWAKAGFTSVADAKTVLGLKSAAYTESSDYAQDSAAVHKTGAETIAGYKTFTNNPTISASSPILYLKSSSTARGTAPASRYANLALSATDMNDKSMWGIYHTMETSQAVLTRLLCYKGTTTDATYASIGVGWDSSGNAYTYAPTPASGDSSTNIATTAFVKAQGYAADSDVVHIAGTENISGWKRFESSVCIRSSVVKGTAPSGDTYRQLSFSEKDGDTTAQYRLGCIESAVGTSNSVNMAMRVYKAEAGSTDNAAIGIVYQASGNVFTYAPHPADAADDSTKIATTGWVRDATGDFACNAATAAKLATARTINGVSFDGSSNIIVEDSTKLPLSGGTLTGRVTMKRAGHTRGTAPSSTSYFSCADFKDSAGNRFGLIENAYYQNKSSVTAIYAYNTTIASGGSIGYLGIGCDTSGDVYTVAPTPATSDNSTKIATTAYVKAQGYADSEDVSSTFTWETGEGPSHFFAYRVGKVVNIFYQGQSKTHSGGDRLGTTTLTVADQTYMPFSKNAAAYGTVAMNKLTGSGSYVNVSQISSTTASGRIYFNGSFLLS